MRYASKSYRRVPISCLALSLKNPKSDVIADLTLQKLTKVPKHIWGRRMHNSWALRFVRSSIDAEEDYLCVSCIVFGGAYHEGCQIRENMRSRIWLRGRIPSGSWQLRGGSPPNFLMFEGQTTEFCGYRHDDSSFLLPSTVWSPDPPAPRWFSPPASFWTVPSQPEHADRSCM